MPTNTSRMRFQFRIMVGDRICGSFSGFAIFGSTVDIWSRSRLLALNSTGERFTCDFFVIFLHFSSNNSLTAFSYPFSWIFRSIWCWKELIWVVLSKPVIGTVPLIIMRSVRKQTDWKNYKTILTIAKTEKKTIKTHWVAHVSCVPKKLTRADRFLIEIIIAGHVQ